MLENGHFNPLPPCGGRLNGSGDSRQQWRFQSTPSVWRETYLLATMPESAVFQSTPSVWRETADRQSRLRRVWISIHSLRVEGDLCSIIDIVRRSISIHSLRVEGDVHAHVQDQDCSISIHSLRVEGDSLWSTCHMEGDQLYHLQL